MNGVLLEVMAFETLCDGSCGPAPHTGDQLLPGDLVSRIGLCDDPASVMSQTSGRFPKDVLLASPSPIQVVFQRPVADHTPRDLAGRPAKRQAKFVSRRAAVHDAIGGAPARKARKPQRTPSHHRTRAKGISKKGRSSGQSSSVGQLLDELLQCARLSAEAQAMRDAELEDTTYIR